MKKLFAVIIPTLNEEEHIENLLKSIYAQNFRSIEVLVIDDGSTDSTTTITTCIANDLNDSTFCIKLLKTETYGPTKGPAIARNIGVANSHGHYVLLVDADCILNNKNTLSKLADALASHSIVGYRDIILVDNWLELNLMLDEGNPPYATKAEWNHLAFKREIFERVVFDPSLGVGEDVDFLQRLRSEDSPFTIDITGQMHFPYTLAEYRLQRIWHGRTRWLFLRKHRSIKEFLLTIVGASPLSFLILAFVLWFLNAMIGGLLFTMWILTVMYFFHHSSIKNPKRLIYLLFRFTYGSFWYSVGLLKGYYALNKKGRIDPSRGK